MKNTIKAIAIIAIMFVSTNLSFAQTAFKFGHINSNELISIMPDKDLAQVELQKYATQLEDQLAAMNKELEIKYDDYMKQEGTLTNIVKEAKQKELQDINTRIQEFQASATQDYQKKEAELLQPIMDKANDAIQAVGKENGFTYIFDVGVGALVYFSEDSQDILPLVKTKLGITQ